MRDISIKYKTFRTARSSAELKVKRSTIRAIKTGNLPKSDPLVVAKIAGIQSAKITSRIIPYCHQVPLDFVNVDIIPGRNSITIYSEVKAIWKTGVEMESLVAVTVAALTLYDMLKPIDETMEIGSIKIIKKTGGISKLKETGNGLTSSVLVISDSVSKGKVRDQSGKFLLGVLKKFKFQVLCYKVLPDEISAIEKEIRDLADKKKVGLVVTTGGTGIGPRDVTPEATLAVIDKRLEGIEETFRSYGQERLPTAMLTRCVVGVRGKTLIVNLPGSLQGVEDGVNVLFPSIFHIFKMIKGKGH